MIKYKILPELEKFQICVFLSVVRSFPVNFIDGGGTGWSRGRWVDHHRQEGQQEEEQAGGARWGGV